MGVQAPNLTPSLVDKWDVDGEAELLAGLHDAGISSDTARVFHDWYVGVFQGALGDVTNLDVNAVEADFRTLAEKRGLSKKLVDDLVKWHRGRLA
jgi:hypothetical protein